MEIWDKDYNTQSISPQQLLAIKEKEARESWSEIEERRRERQHSMGYIEIDIIPNTVVSANFGRWANEVPGVFDYGLIAHWAANRMMWICHNCGCFGFKSSLRETFTCYGCHSHNTHVLRAGEISMAIRGIVPADSIGVSMNDIFAARKERLKVARKNKRRSLVTESLILENGGDLNV